MAYIRMTRDQSATFSHILFLIVHCNEIHIYNGIYTKVNDNLNFELDNDCLNPTIFSTNQSLDLLTNPKIFSAINVLICFTFIENKFQFLTVMQPIPIKESQLTKKQSSSKLHQGHIWVLKNTLNEHHVVFQWGEKALVK